MAEDNSIFGDIFKAEQPEIEPETVGALDYLTDIPLGIFKGASQAVQG